MKKLTCCLLILAIIFSFAFGTAAWADGPVRYDFRSEQGTISLDIDESLWLFVTQDNIAEKLDPEKIDVQGSPRAASFMKTRTPLSICSFISSR